MGNGELDLIGLVTAVTKHGLGKLEASTGLMFADDLVLLVPEAMKQLNIPNVLEIGLAGMVLGKLALAGIIKNQKLGRS